MKLVKDYIKSIVTDCINKSKIYETEINKTLLNKNSQPNGNEHITYASYLSANIKNVMAILAAQRLVDINNIQVKQTPSAYNLTSKLSTQNDIESEWCRYWMQVLKIPFRYHRKLWEYGFVLQTLFEHDMFGKQGLGLACGTEVVPSYLIAQGCTITAGDKPFTQDDHAQEGWASSQQYTQSKESLYHEKLVGRSIFNDNFTLAYVDMNHLPHDLYEDFDFCWSICAIEHLGSIRHGLEFLKNSLRLLRKGGISVHTTEFNLFSDKTTIDNWGSVLFTKKDLSCLSDEIIQAGGLLYSFDFDMGDGLFDRYIDMPPYPHQSVMGIGSPLPALESCPHIKLLVDGFPATCVGVIIQKQ